MHIVTFASRKGGVGKTTLASSIAVRAAHDSPRVAMLDFDPQGNLTSWWARRGEVDNPRIFSGADTIADAIEILDRDGWDWVIIDTSPAYLDSMRAAIEAASLVVVPLKPSAHDLTAVDPVFDMANEAGTKYLVVLNEVHPRERLSREARDYLAADGHPISTAPVARRQAYASSASVGKSGPEVERDNQCAAEVESLWSDIRNAVGAKKRGRK